MDPCIAFASPESPYMTKLWGPGGPKAHTVQHFGHPEEQQHTQYSTLRDRGGKSVHSRTLWGPGPEKNAHRTALWRPRGPKRVHSTALRGPGGPNMSTVQHFGSPGGQKSTQYSTWGARGPNIAHSAALWSPGGDPDREPAVHMEKTPWGFSHMDCRLPGGSRRRAAPGPGPGARSRADPEPAGHMEREPAGHMEKTPLPPWGPWGVSGESWGARGGVLGESRGGEGKKALPRFNPFLAEFWG